MLDPITGGGSIIVALALSGVLGEGIRQRLSARINGKRMKKLAEKMAVAEQTGDVRLYEKYRRRYEKAYRKWEKYV